MIIFFQLFYVLCLVGENFQQHRAVGDGGLYEMSHGGIQFSLIVGRQVFESAIFRPGLGRCLMGGSDETAGVFVQFQSGQGMENF